jgi:hypothetical protein
MLGAILRRMGLRGPKRLGGSSSDHLHSISAQNTRALAERDLAKLASFGPEMHAEFMASKMAAGPCPRAAALDGKEFRPRKAPLPPFDDCPHPDQCACMYRAKLNI